MSGTTTRLRQVVNVAAINLLIFGGIAILVAMLAVTLFLAIQTANGVFSPMNNAAKSGASQSKDISKEHAPIVFEQPAAGTPTPDDAANSSVANAMTAVGTAIAAITLVLSVGTTWLAIKLKEIEVEAAKLKSLSTKYEQNMMRLAKRFEDRNQLQQQLTDAKCSLTQWLDRGGAGAARYSQLNRLNAHLEQLMTATLPAQRQHAFDQMIAFLPDDADQLLLPVENYSQACHAHHGGKDNTYGIWCLIFDPMERLACRREQPIDGPMY